jgi:fluoride ion exporter CrcB/FEX
MHSIRTATYLGVITVVLRHRRWVKPARENLVVYGRGRNTCTALTTISGFSNNYDKVV